jgi:hypothetical protein
MYLHVVDGPSQTIASIPEILKVIDAKYDFLKDYYAGFAIENVVVCIILLTEQWTLVEIESKFNSCPALSLGLEICMLSINLLIDYGYHAILR